MEVRKPRYINPYTDFGFKKLFGEEGNKDLLMDFLNELLPTRHRIAELTFGNSEHLPDSITERKAIFDIYCTAANGEHFIVEMQKAKFKFFKDRSLFYVTYPLRQQMQKGEWDFSMEPIYFIAILDFFYDEKEEEAKFRRDICLKDQDCEVFFDNLHFKFLQMPAFKKEVHELETHFDKWIYFLKNLETFDDIPAILNEPVFQKAFKTAEIANYSPEEIVAYDESRFDYIELRESLKTSKEEGIEEGIEKGRKEGRDETKHEIAKKMKDTGMPWETISKLTGLTQLQIENL